MARLLPRCLAADQHRLYEQRQAQQAGQPTSAAAPVTNGAGTALVLRADQENAEYIHQRFSQLRTGRARRRGYSATAYQRGNERGVDVSLTPSPKLRTGRGASLPDRRTGAA